jgi:hypothetical protein|nr:hypothetical protein [uncultured Alloprevotella sp.]
MIHKQNEEKGILSDKKKEKPHYLLKLHFSCFHLIITLIQKTAHI